MMTATAENRSLNFTQWSEATAAATEPILTLKGTVGEEVSLTFGVYETEDTYSVDFGDGNLQEKKVGINNAGPVDPETGQATGATNFTGTVAGDGTIKVYGNNDVWYLISSGAAPTAFDQAKLMNVVQMTVSGVDVESVALPAYPKMTQFSLNNSAVKTLDVTKVTTLTSLSVDNTTQSKYAPQLESIDLSKNTELNYLKIIGNATNKGKLSAIDLSSNTKLASVFLQDNALTTVTLPAAATLTYLNLQNNLFESLDLTGLTRIANLYLENNKLNNVALGNITKLCKLEGNQLRFETLPAQPAGMNTKNKTKNFTYSPQAAVEFPTLFETTTIIDLTSNLTVAKGELDPADYATYLTATTTFSFVTADGTALVEGTDYEVTEPGKFKFLKEQTAKIHIEMLNAAFPKFTADAPMKTTEFTVTASTGIRTVGATAAAAGKVYNLQGVEVQKPVKGLYIQNGKKVLVK